MFEVHMKIGYLAVIAVIALAVAAVAVIELHHTGADQNQASTTSIATTSIANATYSQQFCLGASNNATAMRIAVSNGVKCFRADIALNPTEPILTSNVTKDGGQYLSYRENLISG
jgi:hypothetical protein